MNIKKINNKKIKSYFKKKLKVNIENYIYELFKILQFKTGNEFRKNQLF